MNSRNTVDVSNMKEHFTDKMCSLYNREMYFVGGTCVKSKYSEATLLQDALLDIYLEENNKLDLCGEIVKYCDKNDTKRRIKLKNIEEYVNQPEVNIYHNTYIVDDDKWDSFQI